MSSVETNTHGVISAYSLNVLQRPFVQTAAARIRRSVPCHLITALDPHLTSAHLPLGRGSEGEARRGGDNRLQRGACFFLFTPPSWWPYLAPAWVPPGFANSDGPQVLGRQADKFRVCIFKSLITSGWAFLTRNRDSLSDPRLGSVRRICAIQTKCYKHRYQYHSACRRACRCPSNQSIRTPIPSGDTRSLIFEVLRGCTSLWYHDSDKSPRSVSQAKAVLRQTHPADLLKAWPT
jgi:hypothetical protein